VSIKRRTGRLENEREKEEIPIGVENGLKKRETGSQQERENKVTKKCRRSRKRVVKGWQAVTGMGAFHPSSSSFSSSSSLRGFPQEEHNPRLRVTAILIPSPEGAPDFHSP